MTFQQSIVGDDKTPFNTCILECLNLSILSVYISLSLLNYIFLFYLIRLYSIFDQRLYFHYESTES